MYIFFIILCIRLREKIGSNNNSVEYGKLELKNKIIIFEIQFDM